MSSSLVTSSASSSSSSDTSSTSSYSSSSSSRSSGSASSSSMSSGSSAYSSSYYRRSRSRRLSGAELASASSTTTSGTSGSQHEFFAVTTHPAMLAYDAIRTYEAFKIAEVMVANGSYPFLANRSVFSHVLFGDDPVAVNARNGWGNLTFPYGLNSTEAESTNLTALQKMLPTGVDDSTMNFQALARQVKKADDRVTFAELSSSSNSAAGALSIEERREAYVWRRLPFLVEQNKTLSIYVEAYASYVEENFTDLLIEKNISTLDDAALVGLDGNASNQSAAYDDATVNTRNQSASATLSFAAQKQNESNATTANVSNASIYTPMQAEYPTAVHFWKVSDVTLYGPSGNNQFVCELGLRCELRVPGNWRHLIKPTSIIPAISSNAGFLRIAKKTMVRQLTSAPTADGISFIADPLLNLSAGVSHAVDYCGADFCIEIGRLYAKGIVLPTETIRANSSEQLEIRQVQELNTTPGSRLYVMDFAGQGIVDASSRMRTEVFEGRNAYFASAVNSTEAGWEQLKLANFSLATATFTFPKKLALNGGTYALVWCAVGCSYASGQTRNQIEAYEESSPEFKRVYRSTTRYQPLVVGNLSLDAATSWILDSSLKCVFNQPCDIRNRDYGSRMGALGYTTILLECQTNVTSAMPVIPYNTPTLRFGAISSQTKPYYYYLCWNSQPEGDFLVTIAPIELVDPRSRQGLPV
ncbi:unnamed protein product [Amoebophrya sp. A25]|nr:unnamed protein product [Amoebophrya sp. A25]|eukprot:GSA25T00011435001.1